MYPSVPYVTRPEIFCRVVRSTRSKKEAVLRQVLLLRLDLARCQRWRRRAGRPFVAASRRTLPDHAATPRCPRLPLQ